MSQEPSQDDLNRIRELEEDIVDCERHLKNDQDALKNEMENVQDAKIALAVAIIRLRDKKKEHGI